MAKYCKTVKSGERRIIGNVIKYCEEEKHRGLLKTSLGMSTRRVAEMTGIPEAAVIKIIKELSVCERTGKKTTPGKTKRTNKDRIEFDDLDLCAIRNITLAFYSIRKEVPTLKKVTAAIRRQFNVNLSRDYVRNVLLNIGFKFKKIENKRTIILEKTTIAALRQKYLRRLNQIKIENPERTIVYLDETWFQPHYIFSDCWQVENSSVGLFKHPPGGGSFLMVHAGTENGFVNGTFLIYNCKSKTGDYSLEINNFLFSKWIQEKLLPNIPENCVIVMDNAPYHSVVLNKAPSATSKKADIQSWLMNNNIDFDDSLLKPELLQLVKRNKGEVVYKIDEVFREAGHEVCRLPPYHCDLNPIELIWNIIKQRVAETNATQDPSKIKDLTIEAVQSVTAKEWKRCCEQVDNIESMYRRQDIIIDNEIKEIIANIADDTDSDSDCSDADGSEDGMMEEQVTVELMEPYSEGNAKVPAVELIRACSETETKVPIINKIELNRENAMLVESDSKTDQIDIEIKDEPSDWATGEMEKNIDIKAEPIDWSAVPNNNATGMQPPTDTTAAENFTDILIKSEPVDVDIDLNTEEADCEIRSVSSYSEDDSKNRITSITSNQQPTPFRCDQCDRYFKAEPDYKIHMLRHPLKKQWKCDHCDKFLPSKSALMTHEVRHTGMKPFKCDQCDQSFTSNAGLIAHKVRHSGIRPFKCDQCDESFNWKTSLMTHKFRHAGDKPFKCDQCGKGFFRKSSLDAHVLLHSGIKLYKCDQCGKGFSHRGSWKKHSCAQFVG